MSQLCIAVHWTDRLDKYSYSHRWVEYLTEQKIKVKKIDLKHPEVIDLVSDCDGVMWHWYHIPDDKQSAPKILDAIETNLGIPVFPNHHTRWHYDEKISQYYLLEALDLPRIKTWLFWDYKQALTFIQNANYPLVFKLSVGAASANVLIVNNIEEAIKYLDKTFKQTFFPYTLNEFEHKNPLLSIREWKSRLKRLYHSIPYFYSGEYPPVPEYYLLQKNYAYFQEFCPGNERDIRITVIGDRAWGFTRPNRPGDFRASGSGMVDYDLNKVPLEAVRMAFDASHKLNSQSMAYDLIYNKNKELAIIEVTYCFVRFAVHDAPGWWDSELNWHKGHLHPEDAQAEDFINLLINKPKTADPQGRQI